MTSIVEWIQMLMDIAFRMHNPDLAPVHFYRNRHYERLLWRIIF